LAATPWPNDWLAGLTVPGLVWFVAMGGSLDEDVPG